MSAQSKYKSLEREKDGLLYFLDVKIFQENEKFGTNLYQRKPAIRYIPTLNISLPQTYKIVLIKSLLFLCSDSVKFHDDVDTFGSILCKSRY